MKSLLHRIVDIQGLKIRIFFSSFASLILVYKSKTTETTRSHIHSSNLQWIVLSPSVQLSVRTRAAEVHLNFRVGSTFPVPVCTVPISMEGPSQCNKVDAIRLYASYRLNLLLLKGQRCLRSVSFLEEKCIIHKPLYQNFSIDNILCLLLKLKTAPNQPMKLVVH